MMIYMYEQDSKSVSGSEFLMLKNQNIYHTLIFVFDTKCSDDVLLVENKNNPHVIFLEM